MKDYELVRIARKINCYQEKIASLVDLIAYSDRPDAGKIVESLFENEIPVPASAEAVILDFISDDWNLYFGHYVYHKSSQSAKTFKDHLTELD